jgi:hypothetical protein
MAAQALKNSRSALGAFYRRLRTRLGTQERYYSYSSQNSTAFLFSLEQG